MEKVKPDRPGQPDIAIVKPAADQITNHHKKLVEVLSLGRHFRLMTCCHEHFFVLFNIEHELLLHAAIVPYKTGLAKNDSKAAIVLVFNDDAARNDVQRIDVLAVTPNAICRERRNGKYSKR
jgi:hypothetical protein